MTEPKFNYSFTADEVDTILRGLNELPRKISDQLFIKIQVEAMNQVREKKEEAKITEENASST